MITNVQDENPICREARAALKAKYGENCYSVLGKIGGSTSAKRHGPKFYSKQGKRGGRTTFRRHGPEHYAAIGRKGGQANKREVAVAS